MTIIDGLVSDGLWEAGEPAPVTGTAEANGGRSRVPPREIFSGIVYVLKTGIPQAGYKG